MKSLAEMISVLLTGVLVVANAAAGDWPQYRGPNGSGVAADKGLPARWSDTENMLYKVDLPGRGLSSPVVAGGRLYLTACSEFKQRRLHVLCFDAATGRKLWERQFAATGSTTCNPTNNMAAPTPVTDGNRVFALFATGDLAALDRDGDLLWYRSLVGDYPDITNQVGMAASPVLHNDLLFLPMENPGESFAGAVDARTGQNRWRMKRERDINWVTPQVIQNDGETAVVFQTKSETTAYEAATGKVQWTFTTLGLSTVLSPLIYHNQVLVSGGDFCALRPIAGKQTPEVVWRNGKLRTNYASGLVYEGKLYVIASPSMMNCVDAATGKLVWQERLKGNYWASPIGADGKIYTINEDGAAIVLKAGDTPEVLATNHFGEPIFATPAIADGRIYFRSDKHLFCAGMIGK